MHPLISTETLAAALAGAVPPVVVDVRWRLGGPPGRQDYEVGHLPGAHYLDLDTDLSSAPGAGGRHPLPSAEHLQRVLRSVGVREGHPVVAYDTGDGSVAARLWWLLRWAGHTEAAVLDGGFAAWVAEGRPVTTEVPSAEAGDVVVRPGGMPVVDAEEAAALARDGVLLDARAPQRYRGEVEPVDPRAGHIPGALNAPSSGHVDGGGRWLGPAALAERFREIGVRPGARVGAYCGSGVTASSVVLALEVAGVTGVDRPAELYAGSWSHWCVDPARPVATGDGVEGGGESERS
ncbi:sulfurtransferase [Saccharothrix australiensis]|uniref:Thiosulfate/3-mercaptopyruvate sulfurtransferase n=1 Tax=Saccharothrix australiensis TaxID=2072 RepID=A0A495VW06_9PSEU|nr:sulfurtransferase [Saccharothrix australiensis]RKT53384.1 thiosulfate/3-mercaptopyruvate sulfurtransferase [Saccharothrix australiensis]